MCGNEDLREPFEFVQKNVFDVLGSIRWAICEQSDKQSIEQIDRFKDPADVRKIVKEMTPDRDQIVDEELFVDGVYQKVKKVRDVLIFSRCFQLGAVYLIALNGES
jgi:hypothetical protein